MEGHVQRDCPCGRKALGGVWDSAPAAARNSGEGSQPTRDKHSQSLPSRVAGSCDPIPFAASRGIAVCWEDRRMLCRICQRCLRTDPCRTQYYTGNFRFWCSRPLIADASLCPAINRTPSSIRAITLSAVQACRKATPFLRQATRTRSRHLHLRWGRLAWNRQIAE
jgi:hypothetical protein